MTTTTPTMRMLIGYKLKNVIRKNVFTVTFLLTTQIPVKIHIAILYLA